MSRDVKVTDENGRSDFAGSHRRTYYEARILVVALGRSAEQLLEEMIEFGLTRISIATQTDAGVACMREVGTEAIATREVSARQAAAAADMVVLLGSTMKQVHLAFSAEIVEEARARGLLLAGVLVGTDSSAPLAQSHMILGGLREQLDNLVLVEDVELAAAFIDALRGGERHGPA